MQIRGSATVSVGHNGGELLWRIPLCTICFTVGAPNFGILDFASKLDDRASIWRRSHGRLLMQTCHVRPKLFADSSESEYLIIFHFLLKPLLRLLRPP